MRRVRARIRLEDNERLQLQAISRKNTYSYGLVQRAQIIILAEKLQGNILVGKKMNISARKVSHWTHRWKDLKEQGKTIIERLSDAERSGKPATINAHQICQLVALACDNPESYGRPITHWTQPELADEAIKQGIFSSISSRHVGRLLARLELRPHKNQYWLHKKIDESREQKIAEICALYKEAGAFKK